MIHIILAVATGVLVLIAFKLFPRYGVSTFPAIVFNYVTAAVTGILFCESPFSPRACLNSNWIYLSLPLGALFIAIFYLISLTTQKVGISTASVANKMSVVIPVLFSIIFLKQEINFLKLTGIVLALAAVYMASAKKENSKGTAFSLLPLMVFIGSGCIDMAINAANAWYIHTAEASASFVISTFASAFICGLICALIGISSGKMKITEFLNWKNLIGGIALGIPNYFSIYFIFRALDAHLLNSSQLFPVLNLSNVIMSAVLAWAFFRERISALNFAGILLAVISIILIAQ